MSHSLVSVNSFVTNGDKKLQCVTTKRRKLSKIPQIQTVENSLKIRILRPNPNFSSVREWHNITKEEAIEFIKDAFPQSPVIYPERSTKSLFEY